MNYNECLEIVRDNKRLEGKYLTEKGELTSKESEAEFIIEKVAVVPLDDIAFSAFRIRLNQMNFNNAIEPHMTGELTVNLFVKNLKSNEYAFLNYDF